MKYYDNLSTIVKAIGFFVIFSNVALILFVLVNLFIKYDTSSYYIWEFCTFIIISLLQLFINRGWLRISEISVRFTLDSLPVKEMAVEAELNQGTISKEDANTKKNELQKDIDFFNSIDGCSKLFSGIGKIITIVTICILIILLIINGTKLVVIDAKYIMFIIIYGILSQLILLFTTLYVGIIITKKNKI